MTTEKLKLAREALEKIATTSVYAPCYDVQQTASEALAAIAAESAPASGAGSVERQAYDAMAAERDRYRERAEKAEAALSQRAACDTAAKMPCGATVANVYEAYEAGKLAARAVGGVDSRAWEWAPSITLQDDEVIFYSSIYQTAEGLPVMTDSSQHGAWNVATVFKRRADGVDWRHPLRILTVEQPLQSAAPVGDGDERAKALEEAVKACECEKLTETPEREDLTYNLGIEHAIAAIRALIQQKG